MRVKKQKRHRKVVRFYSACFGFREPFKVLCDGTFIHHLLLHRLTPADDAVSHLLSSRATLFATKCAVAELRSLGESHADASRASQQLITARCDHEKRVNAAACIEAVIGESNQEHFFVATQDADLRRKLQQIPGVPLIYGVRNSLFLEKPSMEDRKFVKLSEEKRLHISDLEAKSLQAKRLKVIPSGGRSEYLEANDNADLVEEVGFPAQGNTKDMKRKKNAEVADKWQFKRKIAKGPNPLSCKKKKVKENEKMADNKDDGSGTVKKKRSRKRKRAKSSTRTA